MSSDPVKDDPLRVENLGQCPVPIGDSDCVILGHGSGGRLSAELLREVILPAFSSPTLSRLEDQATLPFEVPAGGRLAFTTDSYVVHPLFFPGGDIGKLAVHGTINDLAVGGATPLFLSAGLIIEEGLPLATLERVLRSMAEACRSAGVSLVTGDTKVVDRGKGDGLFVNTSGIGVVPAGRDLSIASARPGDRILVSGTLGDHGIAILSVREGIEFGTELESDTAPLADLTRAMLEACPGIRCMRDPTRGGLSSALNELAECSKVGVEIDERSLPIRREVKGACEMLGLDPLYVANEGKLVAVVPAGEAEGLLEIVRAHPLGAEAALVGEVVAGHPGIVVQRSLIGGERVVTMLAGEQLPRIC